MTTLNSIRQRFFSHSGNVEITPSELILRACGAVSRGYVSSFHMGIALNEELISRGWLMSDEDVQDKEENYGNVGLAK